MKHAIIIAAALAALCSCSSIRYAKDFSAEQVDGMALFAPDSYVNYIAADGFSQQDDSLSALACEALSRGALELGLPVSKTLPLDGDEYKAMKEFMQDVIGCPRTRVFECRIPAILDGMLEREGSRYGLILVSEGMKRDIHRYRAKLALGIAMAVITAVISFGSLIYEDIPVKHTSHVWAALIDSAEDRLVFFDSVEWEMDPVNARRVKKQVANLMKDFPKK